jgi:predicted unusual protein kinase regulating ubiquinone biosynthesis (AarF/ABC1/UbiB family)
MNLTLGHLKRYKDIARLIAKHGRAIRDLPPGLLSESGPIDESAPLPEAEELARDLEQMGPTFVKLGQVLATRVDLLPEPYLIALERLQDRVEPFPIAEVEAIVERELGVRISKAFSEFEPTPLAAASLGQVHRAALRDGRRVVVKVQRPGVQEALAEDLAALEQAAALLDAHTKVGQRYQFTSLLAEFEKSLARELDYQEEARNLQELAEVVADFENIVVPLPVLDFTNSRVLTMDYVRGRKITKIGPLRRLEMDGTALADELFRAYLHQVLVVGFFHADPHPGNVFLTDDGRLALLDLGMTGRISPRLQDSILRLLLAASEGRGEEAATIAAAIGERLPDYDEARFQRCVTRLVAENRAAPLHQIAVGRLVIELTQQSAEAGLRMPPELALLGKTLLNLDAIGRALDPEFDPNRAIRRHAAGILSRRLRHSFTPGSLLAAVDGMKELVEHLPERANKILDRIANNDLEVRVDAIDEGLLMEGFQKVANRIAVGLVLAALIVGAALLMQVPTSFRILGYPGLAIVCYLTAAAGGVALVVSILIGDRRTQRKTRHHPQH